MADSAGSLLSIMGVQAVDYFGSAPNARTILDERGWYALSGEDSADLNMGCVLEGPDASSFLDELVEVVGALPAIVLLEKSTPGLLAQSAALGAEHVGEIPVMLWDGGEVSRQDRPYTVRTTLNIDEDLAAIALMAEAFSLDLQMARNVLKPVREIVGADLWIAVEGNETLGTGSSIRTENTVGIYSMATPERNQRRGIGRAILETMMVESLAKGAKQFLLGATSEGFHLYEQMGFKVVATPAALVIGTSTQFH